MPRRIIVRRSAIHGNGVFAAMDLPTETIVIEYRGRRLTHRQADRLYGGNADSGHTFIFSLNDQYVIDGNVEGNSARWINHSCAPNCRAYIQENTLNDPRQDRIFIETLRAIRQGEEITFDYGIRLSERHTVRMKRIWACRCGEKNCSGTILKSKR